MAEINPYAAPLSDVVLDMASPEPYGGAWRDGELLVVRKGAVQPDRCVKTFKFGNGLCRERL